MSELQGIGHETASRIVAALESAGEEVLVASESPLVIFHCSGPDSPVNCLLEKPWSAETVYCGFVCDDGEGGNPAARFASENVRISWLLSDPSGYAESANEEHLGLSPLCGKLFRNKFIPGGLAGPSSEAIAAFDMGAWRRWFDDCLANPEIRPDYRNFDDVRPSGRFPPIEPLEGQEESALDAFAGHDDWLCGHVMSRDVPEWCPECLNAKSTQKTSHETIEAIVDALESSGAKTVVASENPLALFFNTGPDEPVNVIADSDDSEPRVLCGFIGDDGFGGDLGVRCGNESASVEWLLSNTAEFIGLCNEEHRPGGGMENDYLRGGMDDPTIRRIMEEYTYSYRQSSV